MNEQNDMVVLSGRAEKLIGALTDAILSTAEVAAERITLASELARISQRMAAFGAVLEAVGVQKDALLAKLDTATGTLKALYQRQIEVLSIQELAILERVGVSTDVANAAVVALDNGSEPIYRRSGKKFERVSCNGDGAKYE